MTALSSVRYLHHVAVQTAHFYQAVQFYRDVLGAELLVHGLLARLDGEKVEIREICAEPP